MAKKGKYADVLPGLPKFQGSDDPSFNEAINAVKRKLIEHAAENGIRLTGNYLAERYIALRKEKDALDEQIKKKNVVLEALSAMLIDQYEVEGTTRIVLDTGESVGIQAEPYAQVKDKEKVREWAIKNGMENELQLLWQTVNSLTKAALLNGQSAPDGVEVFQKWKPVFRK